MERPIFVIGHQRSGTTLLQSLLGAHSRIAAPPELYFIYRVAHHAEYFGELTDDGNLRRALREALDAPLDILAACGWEFDTLLERARQGPRTYRGLFEALMGDFAERQGKVRWSEKSPGQTLGEAYALVPDAQFVHIVRDPRDVVASSVRAPMTEPDVTAIARGWRDFTLRNVRRGFVIGPAQYLQLRYEDLTRDPAAVLRIVCAFLGEDYEPAMLEDPSLRRVTVPEIAKGWQGGALESVRATGEGRWRTRLGRRDQWRVHAVVGPLLAALGYEPPGLRERLPALPLAAAESAQRVLARRRRPPAATPAERYRLAREFIDSRVRMVEAERDA
jgi:LPS sulfotransferase NodH